MLSKKQGFADFSKSDNFLRQFEYKKALSEVLLVCAPFACMCAYFLTP